MSPETKPVIQNAQNVLRDAEAKMQKSLEAVTREFVGIRTGRASPSLVEGVRVEYFGTPTPLKQMANLSTPDPKMLVIQPWDLNAIPEIEKALLKADLGLTPVKDGKILRVPIPPLSTERREELIKVTHRMSEEGKVAIRSIRHAAREAIEKLLKDKLIAEDDKFKNFEALEKLTQKFQQKVDELLAAKEAELKTV